MCLDFNKYKNTLSYPKREDYKTIYVTSKGKLIAKKRVSDITAEEKKEWAGLTQETEFDEVGYRAAQNAYDTETSRLEQLFKADALEFHGLTDHPKADKAYSLAWENGHSSGYNEVFNCLYDYADLLLS